MNLCVALLIALLAFLAGINRTESPVGNTLNSYINAMLIMIHTCRLSVMKPLSWF